VMHSGGYRWTRPERRIAVGTAGERCVYLDPGSALAVGTAVCI
jgi:hypothetical protein